MMAQTTPEQAQAGMDEWMKWAQVNGDSGNHVEMNSISPGAGTATGFSILEADSLDAATKMVRDHPHFHTPGASIEVLEFLAVPGMEG